MNKVRSLTTCLGLAFLVTACSAGSATPSGSGGSAATGGTSGSASGGSSGSASGGTSGGTTGGTSGTATGGTTASSSGGTSGTATGGSSGTSTGGTSPGSGGAPGSGGGATGGTQGSGGASAAGGTSATGGASPGSGGASATGGAPGSGGAAPAPSNVLMTSASGAYWKTGMWTEASSGTADLTVNDSSAQQSWEGMGGAFNEMGWSYLTTKAMQDQALQMLFGADGCNFAWGRIPMGASDYAMDRYTDDEVSSGTDPDMTSFSIDRDKMKLIPYIQAAQAVKPNIRFWASPWTPPTWMKMTPYLSPGNPVNAFDGGTMKSDDATLKAHAQYFVKFVDAYKGQNIKIEYVSPQNEPNYAQNYPSCLWSGSTFATFVGKYLGPALMSASSTAQVMMGTMSNNGSNADVAVANTALGDATAKPFFKVIGVQWGMSDAGQISNLKSKGAGIPIWITEHKCGNYPSGGNSTTMAPNDQAYGVESWGYIRDAIKNGVTAYNAWNMVLNKAGKGIDNTRAWAQNALLVADSGQVTATPAYYVFRHISQFVDPGATVVGTSGSSEGVAFKNADGSLVAVLYSASAKSNYIVAIGGKKLQFSMPAGGWATVKYKP